MADDNNLYFIPLLSHALESDDPARAMEDAFRKIRLLGEQPDYEEGFRQFVAFIKAALKPSGEDSEERIQRVRDAVYRLIYSLATNTFKGDKEQKDALIKALISTPGWNSEYERIKEEAQDFLAPEIPIRFEVLRGDRFIGSAPVSPVPASISPVPPGSYTIRFSNGRVLWEGDFTKEDVIWAFAYPGKELPMAAETEAIQREPTRSISLLKGELIIHIFAGLETGELRIVHGKTL